MSRATLQVADGRGPRRSTYSVAAASHRARTLHFARPRGPSL